MAAPAELEIEANGLRFETLLAGPEDGEAVILLHGYPQSAASWRGTMEWLADGGYRAIAPNLRGYSPGANPPEASAYRMGQLVGDVIGIADAQGAKRFHLVGHDWGGALAWAVAGAHPKRLLSLTVLSTPHSAAMLEALRSSTQSLRSLYMGFFRIPRVPETMLNFANLTPAGLGLRLFRLPRASWQRDRAQLQRVGGLHGPLNWYRGAIKGSTRRQKRITVPTLYIWGRRDPFLGRRAAELTAKYVTGPYRFEELNAGHWIIDRNADDLQRLLGEHLESHRAAERTPNASTVEAAASDSAPAATPQRAAAAQVESAAQTAAATQQAGAARRRAKATTARTSRAGEPASTQTPDATAQGKPKPAAKSAGNRRKGTP
jgi:pimeloyl-ACP methyl ester carboxylesterase